MGRDFISVFGGGDGTLSTTGVCMLSLSGSSSTASIGSGVGNDGGLGVSGKPYSKQRYQSLSEGMHSVQPTDVGANSMPLLNRTSWNLSEAGITIIAAAQGTSVGPSSLVITVTEHVLL